jgi:hypothetical protein
VSGKLIEGSLQESFLNLERNHLVFWRFCIRSCCNSIKSPIAPEGLKVCEDSQWYSQVWNRHDCPPRSIVQDRSHNYQLLTDPCRNGPPSACQPSFLQEGANQPWLKVKHHAMDGQDTVIKKPPGAARVEGIKLS